MKNYNQILKSLAVVCLGIFFVQCSDDDEIPQTDYSIESSSYFEVISQHQNGWIKQGQQNFVYPESQVSKEFEYYENGYIKSAKVYANSLPHHLYMEVSRSEDNKPIWSKYYNTEGELWFETEYTNGLPSVKKVYSEEGTAIQNYTNGDLSLVEFTTTDNSSTITTTYNAAAGSRNVTITNNDQTILQADYPYQEQVGAGVYMNTDVPVANPFGDTEANYIKKLQSSGWSPKWENRADPIEFMFPYRNHYEYYNQRIDFSTKFAVSTDLYQSVIEQYPVTENGVLMGGVRYLDGYEDYFPSIEVRDSLALVHDENPALYELKYGKEYVRKVGWGKTYLVIGAIRNLPTDSNAADKVKNIARRRMDELLGGNTSLTAEEQEILNKVWFEIKFFSTLKEHRNGMVINSAETYNSAMEAVDNAESSVIQLEYDLFEYL
jgi:hypothetical protein